MNYLRNFLINFWWYIATWKANNVIGHIEEDTNKKHDEDSVKNLNNVKHWEMFKHEVFKEERSTYFANKNPAIYFLPIIPLSIFEIMYFLIPELSMRHHSRSNLIGYTLLEFSDNFFSRHSCKNRNQHFIYIVFQNNVCPINPSRLSDGLKERCASLHR